uniref:RING-type E3 ubiquitin transferase n=1 Tax=Oryza rufipogon TaxID=4529 RepID=A0A0E0PR27_ORYRU
MAPPRRDPNPNHLLLVAVLLLLVPATVAAAATYSDHCHGLPSAPDLAGGGGGGEGGADPTSLRLSLQLNTGYFSGGGARLFGPDLSIPPRSFSFLPSSVVRTTDASLLHVSATLTVSGGRRRRPPNDGRHLLVEYDGQAHRFRPRLPRFAGRRGSVTFGLEGYYSSASGELCMVGTGSGRAADGTAVNLLSAVLRVRYPGRANLTRPFVTGSLESTDSPSFFEPVSLVTYAEEGYAYAESASCPPPPTGRLDALQVFEGSKFSCAHLSSLFKATFRLDYTNGSSESTASSLGLHQRFMFINRMRCADDGAVRAYVVFANQTDVSAYYFMLGEKAMVVEGFWDEKRSRLCLKGCHVVNSGPSRADLAVGECGIGMSFWFPAVWSLQERSFAAGLVWNTSLKSGEGIAASSNTIAPYFRGSLSGLKYNYTKVDEAKKYYEKYGLNKKRKGKFPDSNSYRDLTFRFFLQKGGGSGYASPVTIGSMLYDGNSLVDSDHSYHIMTETNHRLLNVSYDIHYVGNWSLETFRRQHISAEGVYDAKTGSLCMIACRVVNISLDCEILVTAQFSPLDTKVAQHVKGTIRSLRKKTDPLFFEPLDIASYGLYIDKVDESMWRMDLESTMALISMTLSCLFIAVQLFHVKKVPEALPAMSITMLVVLSLGYMIPLVLNFEALFKNSNKQTFPLSGGGWLEVNEVIVRIITMVTFLMQLRLLQLACSARSMDVSKDQSWAAEKKVLWICLPLYIIGAVAAWVVHMQFNNNRRMLRKVARLPRVNRHAFWEDLVSYGGLILDGFLLPQVILNACLGSKVKALSPGFYIGSTMIRALPHVYDVFRAKHFVPSLRPFYRYANPRDDLFSLAWDIAIPCGAILLSVLLFLQQRFGGAFFICSKNRKASEYEMVSTVIS